MLCFEYTTGRGKKDCVGERLFCAVIYLGLHMERSRK